MQYVGIKERMLMIDISWCCWLQKPLRILAFSKKLVTNFPLTYNVGIDGTFLPLTKVLSIDQYVFKTYVFKI